MKFQKINKSLKTNYNFFEIKRFSSYKISKKDNLLKQVKSTIFNLNFTLCTSFCVLIFFEFTATRGIFFQRKVQFFQPINFLYELPGKQWDYIFSNLNFHSVKFLQFGLPYKDQYTQKLLQSGILLPESLTFDFEKIENNLNFSKSINDKIIQSLYSSKHISNIGSKFTSFSLSIITSILIFLISYKIFIKLLIFIFTKLLPTAELEKLSKLAFLLNKKPTLLAKKGNKLKAKNFIGFDEISNDIKFFIEEIKKNNANNQFSKINKINKNKSRDTYRILLIGESGNGKTFLAKVIAGECALNLVQISPFDLFENKNYFENDSKTLDPIDNDQQIRLLKMYFNYANNYSPCALFFDNFEFFAKKRSDVEIYDSQFSNKTTNPNSTQLVSLDLFTQFLVQIDGLKKQNKDIVLLAATTNLNSIDPALIRSGRFDKHIYLKNPNLKIKSQLIQTSLSNLNCRYKFNWINLFYRTKDFTNSSIIWLIKTSYIYSILYNRNIYYLTNQQLETCFNQLFTSHNSKIKDNLDKLKERAYTLFSTNLVKTNQENQSQILKDNKNFFTNNITNYQNLTSLNKLLIPNVIQDIYYLKNYNYKTTKNNLYECGIYTKRMVKQINTKFKLSLTQQTILTKYITLQSYNKLFLFFTTKNSNEDKSLITTKYKNFVS